MALTKLTTDLIDGTIVTSVNGNTGAVTLDTGGGGTTWVSDPKTANFTAVAGEGYFVDTTSTAITVTLPSSPTAGDEVSIVDYAGTADTNNITITSSDNINGSSDDVKIDYERGGVSMVYVDATQGWIAYNAVNETATALGTTPLTVDYLVVAGGGAGGTGFYGGGGGAGGLRTSYGTTTGGGGSAETELTLSRNTSYTLTIGAGGTTGGTAAGTRSGGSGSNSVFSTITSTGGGGAGGGGGQGDSTASDVSGKDGGSGGGVAQSNPYISTIGEAVTTPVIQGYDGGSSAVSGSGAGGGGAGAVGTNAPSSTGGNGGDGLAVNIISTTNAGTASVGEVSGSDVYFAGGGGGSSSGGLGTGGLGGGADGDARFSGTPNAGSPNSGGGGAGAGNNTETGGSGGSGVVILRYPNYFTLAKGSGIIEASGSPFTEGTDKVSVFTAGTGTISFS